MSSISPTPLSDTLHERDQQNFDPYLIEHLSVPLFLVNKDGRCVTLNKAARELSGYDASTMRELSFWSLLSDSPHEQGEGDVKKFARPRTLRQPLGAHEKDQYDAILRCCDGSLLPVSVLTLPYNAAPTLGPLFLVEVRPDADQSPYFRQLQEGERRWQEGEAILRLACEASRIGVHDYNVRTGVLNWDTRVREIWGADEQVITIDTFWAGVHPADHESVRCRIEEAFDPLGSRTYVAEYRVINRKTNQQFWIMAQGAVTFEDGHPIRLVGIVQDYTAQKQAEEQLAEQEQRFRLLAEINPIGIQHARSNGQIIYCNPAYCALTGYELEEFVSGKVTWIDLTPPEWLTLDEAKAREARGQGGVCVPYEKEYIRKDGTRIPVLVGFALITKESDESVAFIIDRSQLRKSQQLLDAAQQRAELLAQMLDSSTQPFGAGTLDGKMVLFNKAYQELTGYSEEELRHATWSDDLTPPEWREAEQKVLEQLTQSGVPQVYEKEYVRKDGTRVPIEIRVNMATSKSDGKQLYYGFLTDLSERRRFEQALIDADRKKDEFLATLAHELRNPLAPLRNGLQLLKRLPEGSEVAIKVREVMERQLGHMVHLIEDLLDVSRIRSGKVVLRLERVALSDVCATALEASRPVIEAGQHELRVHVPEDPIYLRVDHTRISQVISNLLNNAAKYTPPGGIIRLVVKREDQWLLISVSDNGLGIPKDMLPKVFTLFTQVEHGMNRAQGGLGIGLALVKKLVELHGGTVEVYSNGANQGSTFTVKLPFS